MARRPWLWPVPSGMSCVAPEGLPSEALELQGPVEGGSSREVMEGALASGSPGGRDSWPIVGASEGWAEKSCTHLPAVLASPGVSPAVG